MDAHFNSHPNSIRCTPLQHPAWHSQSLSYAARVSELLILITQIGSLLFKEVDDIVLC